jgi:hypothetical protein
MQRCVQPSTHQNGQHTTDTTARETQHTTITQHTGQDDKDCTHGKTAAANHSSSCTPSQLAASVAAIYSMVSWLGYCSSSHHNKRRSNKTKTRAGGYYTLPAIHAGHATTYACMDNTHMYETLDTRHVHTACCPLQACNLGAG